MPIYKAPLRDQQFVIHEVLNAVDVLKALPRHADIDADTINQVVEQAGKFCEELLLPINQSGDAEGCTYDAANHAVKTPQGFKPAYEAFCAAGWPGLAGQTEFGGQGRRTVSLARSEGFMLEFGIQQLSAYLSKLAYPVEAEQ